MARLLAWLTSWLPRPRVAALPFDRARERRWIMTDGH